MAKIINQINEAVLEKTIKRCRERNITIPTFSQQKDPTTIPVKIKSRLSQVAMNDLDPVNLYRITWKNEPAAKGGFNQGNTVEFPSSITGVPARIVGLMGRYFPTGAHKVGAAFGCLVPRLVAGQFDPTTQKAVWPSTGNYCRGGAFDSALLGCTPIAILPEQMSKERFEWLKTIGAEVITTPGGEANVKEIYDKCWEIKRTRPDCVIFNQFEEFGNAIWHYHVTGGVVDEIFNRLRAQNKNLRLSAWVSATGSAGTISAGDYIKKQHPGALVIATEALQCPTLLRCGFGDHRIEGIGDKHVPWIHNVRNTDMITAIDDEACLAIMRLFNEDTGKQLLIRQGVSQDTLDKLPAAGISGICNLVAAIKAAKYYDMTSSDVIFFPMTDSMELYGSRILEQREIHGPFRETDAAITYARYLQGAATDNLRELNYQDRKQLHNFKYFTWVEQQQRSADDLRAMWSQEFWEETFGQVEEWDRLIENFNSRIGSAA
ncbi:MAG TPA: pyridoxal-phosphate dependent enzyme [Tepidisphaeraceae bacterium]|jgi:cysteine synthase